MGYFDSICGYEQVKQELEQIADILAYPDRYRAVGSRMPAGLLIDGEPGLGKTLMANCLIQASGLPSFTCRKNCSKDSLLDAIREAFDSAAQNSPAIVFLDDMDKFSNSDYELRDTKEYVTVQSCIDEHKGKGVFVLATTNQSDRLPQSLLREGRFDRRIKVEAPYGEDALAVVEHYLRGKACALDVGTQDVADIIEGHSCAFLETVINEASLLAGFERAESISLDHFIKAYMRVESGGNTQLSCSQEHAPDIDDIWASERAQTAYHEAGHVVAMEAIRPKSASIALILVRQGRLSGLTKSRRLKRMNTFNDVRADALVSLAGHVAVEMKYGVPSLGCRDDFNCVAGDVGMLMRDSMNLGAYFAMREDYMQSSALDAMAEGVCALVVEQLRWEVRELLARNWASVEAVANSLYKKGYILAEEIGQVMGSRSQPFRSQHQVQVA